MASIETSTAGGGAAVEMTGPIATMTPWGVPLDAPVPDAHLATEVMTPWGVMLLPPSGVALLQHMLDTGIVGADDPAAPPVPDTRPLDEIIVERFGDDQVPETLAEEYIPLWERVKGRVVAAMKNYRMDNYERLLALWLPTERGQEMRADWFPYLWNEATEYVRDWMCGMMWDDIACDLASDCSDEELEEYLPISEIMVAIRHGLTEEGVPAD